jgi:AAA domain
LSVVDTLSRTFGGGNENDSADMASFVANIDKIRAETGTAVLVVHHSGKDDNRGMRGHSILKAAADTVLEVGGQEGARTVTVGKQKDGETGATYSFNLETEEVGTDDDGQPMRSCVVVPTTEASAAKKTSKRLPPEYQKALDYLLDLIVDKGETITMNGVPPAARVVRVDDWREDLKRRGLHDGAQAGKKWFQRVRTRLIAENRILSQGDIVWSILKNSDGAGV